MFSETQGKKMKQDYFWGRFGFATLSLLCLLAGGALIYTHALVLKSLPFWPIFYMTASLVLAILFNFVLYKNMVAGFLLTVFFTLISSRIAALHQLYLLSTILFASVIVMLVFYRCYAAFCIEKGDLSLSDSVLIFLRLYVGFNFIPHFTEKLLAGNTARLADIQAFTHLGIPHPEMFVILSGFCELGAAIAIGLGLLTRLGAILTAIYLLIATYLGHHFSLGFIWASTGGGWEYPVFWTVLVLIFAVTGANQFSLDSLRQIQPTSPIK